MKDGFTLIGMLVSLIGMFSVPLLLAAWAVWAFHADGGYKKQKSQAVVDIDAAYEAGRYAQVVSIYETPVVASFHSDIRLPEEQSFLSPATEAQIADSYARTGNSEAALALYIQAIGWSPGQYNAYCSLVDDCRDLGNLQAMAGN